MNIDDSKKLNTYYLIQNKYKLENDQMIQGNYETSFHYEDGYLLLKGEKRNIIFSVNEENRTIFSSKNDMYVPIYGLSKRLTGEEGIHLGLAILDWTIG